MRAVAARTPAGSTEDFAGREATDAGRGRPEGSGREEAQRMPGNMSHLIGSSHRILRNHLMIAIAGI